MDSLHPSLSQALPLRDYDAEQALQAPFRAAALGIATFYKKASENGRKAYSLGYSSALQDVLAHLQTALDQPDPQHSQESMAFTIQRVVDYIQRRQEALRAESQEPNDEDPAQPLPTPHHPHRHSTTPPSRNTLSPTDQQVQTQSNPTDNHPTSNQPEPPSSAPASSGPCPSASQAIRRRTSPQRITPVTFQPSSADSHPHGSSFGQARPPTSPSSTCGPSRHPFNLNFSSFAASPLPQHHQSSSTSTTSSSSRRHRGAPIEGARKGKLKERTDRSSVNSSLDPTPLFHHGYAHYGPNPTSSSSGDPKPLSLMGSKRRFPTDCALSNLDSPAPIAPQPVRITRRTNNPPKSLATPIEESNVPSSAPPHEAQITVHHHHDQDDVLMVLQGGNELNEDGIERPSKRFFSCKNFY